MVTREIRYCLTACFRFVDNIPNNRMQRYIYNGTRPKETSLFLKKGPFLSKRQFFQPRRKCTDKKLSIFNKNEDWCTNRGTPIFLYQYLRSSKRPEGFRSFLFYLFLFPFFFTFLPFYFFTLSLIPLQYFSSMVPVVLIYRWRKLRSAAFNSSMGWERGKMRKFFLPEVAGRDTQKSE